ncbi:aldehyde dehydrogenase family protein [Acinetobacter pseudolwoffii]|uniref:aldehyde dehydrogenase family protein n=1 Tax=Acinetobacter pseudolwoffii TaxID=2053287 RepID=UPI002468768A|nr:aldehyde dehydrogenase family protein [Acinetobacter pseudolwoffii]MDH5821158.1 aldehyde dehydrogenase family protein [Acinetobacter pseudolwoffii]
MNTYVKRSTHTYFPRVTYASSGEDFTQLHEYLDGEISTFKAENLGKYYPNIIGGETREGNEIHTALSPIDNETILGTFALANEDLVNEAVKKAQEAYKTWSATPWQERVARVRRWADVLTREKYNIAIATIFEIGKSRIEALGEADEVLDMIPYYCDEMVRNNGYHQSLRRAFAHEETSTRLRPLGVFGVISPFNFPLALSVNLIVGAILTGNTVVYKPSPDCGMTATLLIEALQEVGLGDLVQLVHGHDVVGKAIVNHPNVAGIAFTGSYNTGMAIFRQVNSGIYTKPVIAEMGGKNPAYVSASADLKTAASGVARSAFGLQGQKCSANSVVYVHESVKDAFVKELITVAEALKFNDPTQKDTFGGPVYNKAAFDRYLNAVEEAKAEGTVLFGGNALNLPGLEKAYYVSPAIVEVPKGHRLTKDELFAPFVAIRTFSDLEEAIVEGNDVIYGLAAGIYTQDDKELEYFLNFAEAGALYANRASGSTTGAWPGIQSFCGWKGSGVGHKGGLGPNFIQQFMREQSHTVIR